ncbi:MAG: LamG domain-containing protein [Nanoarchaeota archaeon]|nr:LamG domain-containing protein [Nanoarchaeota archaeon]
MNSDSYNDAEGAYVFRASATSLDRNSLVFNISGVTYTRYTPVFKIYNYTANVLPTVILTNSTGSYTLTSGTDYNAAFQNNSNSSDIILVQYLRNIGSNVQFNINSESKGAISTIPGTRPFWTSSTNPDTCQNLKRGYSCTTSWTVNATGIPGDAYTFFVIYDASSYSDYVLSNETGRINITIDGGNMPDVTGLSITPPYPNTTSTLQCYATILSNFNSSLNVEYWWYNNSVLALSGNTTGVSNNTNTLISALGDGSTTYGETWNCTIRAYDGTSYSGYNSTAVYIYDQTNPSCQVLPIIEDSIFEYQYNSSYIIYYNNYTSGTFNVTVLASDSEAGIRNVTFPAAVSIGSVDTASPYQITYVWDQADSFDNNATATCYDATGNSNTTTFSIYLDNAGPTGGHVGYTGSFTNSTQVTFSSGSDAGSGVNASRPRLFRKSANVLDNNICGSYSAWSPIGSPAPSSPYIDSLTGTICYQYTYAVWDNVENNANFTNTSELIYNNRPTHTAPNITPAFANATSNLTCNWNSVSDLDGNTVRNITNWYKNNVSTTVLYMPFEGVGGRESTDATDYSGYGNNGTVFGAQFNRTGGRVGGAYSFDGIDDFISTPASISLSPNSNITIEGWIRMNESYNMTADSVYGVVDKGDYQLFLANYDGKLYWVLNDAAADAFSWPTGQNLVSNVFGMAVWNSDLYVSGDFADAGGDSDADRIAKWDGSAFSWPTGQNLSGAVSSMAVWDGDLYIGGSFADAGGDSDADRIAKWDGSAFSWPTGQTPSSDILSMVVWNGDLIIGGQFTAAGGDPDANYIAKWNGTAFSWPTGQGLSSLVYSMAVWNGDLYVGGSFADAGGDSDADRIGKFGTSSVKSIASATSQWTSNTWYHIAGTYDGTYMRLFVNGVLENSAATSISVDSTGKELYIGKMHGNQFGGLYGSSETGELFQGTIDEIKIYNSSVSADQILADYNAGSISRNSIILIRNETSVNETWLCSVTPNDGYSDGVTLNSSSITILNTPPTHGTPFITPSLPNTTSDLTCNWNSIQDIDGDEVVNITNWYKNNVSATVLYMPFEGVNGRESTNATDYSGFGNNGTVFGAAWDRTGGKVGGGYNFDGDLDYIGLRNPIRQVDTFTISLWVKPKFTSDNAIFFSTTSSNEGWAVAMDRSYGDCGNGDICIWLYRDGVGGYIDYAYDLPVNQWSHLAVTYSNITGELVIYLNGTRLHNETTAWHPATGGAQYSSINYGDPTWGPADMYLNGSIDEIKIYNYTLTQPQVLTEYLAGVSAINANIIDQNETSANEQWICAVTPNDGYTDGVTKNSTAVSVQNLAPTHDTPFITPSLPNTTSNLTCNWNSVSDLDNDNVVNITTWYKNNVSTTVLYMPFEGVNGRESTNATDYSGYGNNGTVFGATWNRTGGKVGGAYAFDGSDDYINTNLSFTGVQNFTVTLWAYTRVQEDYKTFWSSDVAGGGCGGDGLFLGNSGILYFRVAGAYVTATIANITNRWVHVSATYNPTSRKVFIDGMQNLSDAGGSATTGNVNFQIGAYNNCIANSNFNGSIDEVRVYNYTLSPEQIWADYQIGLSNRTANLIVSNELALNHQWTCSVTPNDGYADGISLNSSSVTVQSGNIAPSVTAFTLRPLIANTSSILECNATIVDDMNTTSNVEYWWHNSSSLMLGGNKTVLNNTNTIISTLGAGNTTKYELWNCTIRAYDGSLYSGYNSTTLNISNEPPLHGMPTIIPALPNKTSNLTCNWNSASDSDSDNILNITNWYRNNVSTTVLYLPFEGGSNSTYTSDYSGHGNEGIVYGATWNRTGGMVGGAYSFDDDSNYIDTNYNFSGLESFTVSLWAYTRNQGNYRTFWSAYDNSIFCGGDGLFLGNSNVLYFRVAGDLRQSTIGNITNNWVNIVAMYNSTGRFVYIDGKLNLSDVGGSPTTGVTPLQIGEYDDCTGGTNFLGLIDEFKFYNYTLSLQQIQADYQAGLTGHPSGIIINSETSVNEEWLCSVTPNDGYVDGNTLNSSSVTIQNSAPTHDAPYITPTSPNTTSNLTCNWNNVQDVDGHSVVNITNWYKNNVSTTVLYMPFEGVNGRERTNATDYSGYGNNGTVLGAVWNRTGGKIGGGYVFDGTSSKIDFGETQWDGSWKNHTLSVWIKWNGKGLMAYDTIISKGQGQPAGFQYFIWTGGGGLGNIQFNMNSITRTATTQLTPNDGMWHFLVVSLDTYNVTFYLDGVFDGSYSITEGGNNDFKLGTGFRDAATPTDYFNGSIDELKIYSLALSEEQILNEYISGVGNKSSNTVVSDEIFKNEQLLCSVTPNDGYTDGETKNSSSVSIANLPPGIPTLLSPSNGNTTIWSNPPTLYWQNVSDPDGDQFNFTVNITSSACPDIGLFNNISALNFTPSSEMLFDCVYFWQVRATDGVENGTWSEKWNFSIQPAIILTLTTKTVDFGTGVRNTSEDTDNGHSPLVVRNDGNIVANITYISINHSLWDSVGDNTEYLQFKIDNDTTEANSFNWTASTTVWTNLTTIDNTNKTAVCFLEYNDANDTAEIDIKLTIPYDEPGGQKTSTIYIIGQQS